MSATTQPFNLLLDTLNPAQREAVGTIEGAVMVIAGPGTGKTQILTLRIANILQQTQVNPENILALTFTESGVYAMRKRLVNSIGTPGYRVAINTFHGFCNELIQQNPEEFPHLISSENATELDQIEIIEKIIMKEPLKLLKPFGDPFYYVRPTRDAISDLKKEGISVEKFEQAIVEEDANFGKIGDLYHEKGAYKGKMKSVYEKQLKNLRKNKELVLLYRAYQEELHNRKLYDFNDMLLEVIKVLETNSQFLLSLQEHFQYILIDEHQDTNASQNKIVELLCNFYPNPNLFVVGDEKQAIYRFQGASLENFLYFKKLYPEAVLINLRENYRSCQTILDASGSLISNNKLASKVLPTRVELFAKSNHPQERVKIIASADYYGEYYYLGEEIKRKIASGVTPSEIAILGKENRDVLPFVDVFEQLGIEYVIESTQNILQDIYIQKLITLFSAIHNLGSDSSLIKAMHVDCLETSPMDIYRLMQYARSKKVSLWEVLDEKKYVEEIQLKDPESVQQCYEKFTLWKTISHNERFDFLFKTVLNESGFMKSILKQKNSLQILDKVTGLYEEIKTNIDRNPSFQLSDFMLYLDLLKKHEIMIKKSPKTIRKNAIRLMTAHKSKGLEFDYVYIINAFDGHWGNTRKRGNKFSLPWDYLRKRLNPEQEEEKNEDERRLFYVALTRARKEVIITYSTYGIDGKEQVPSQFINEIVETYRELVNIEEFEKNFLANKQIILSPLSSSSADVLNEYLANKDYFAEVFARRGFAVSHLNNYLECPWRYFFRNLLGLPDVMTKDALFGTAVHKAINTYLITQNPEYKTIDFLLNSFYEELQHQPLTQMESVELKEKGTEVLIGYHQEYMLQWKNNLMSEFTIKGIRFSDNVTLTGKLDMIEPQENSRDVIIYDFKTGKPKSRGEIEGTTQSSNGNYKRQLVFYKILLDRYQFQKMNMVAGVIDFVQPNDRGIYKREVFAISDEEVHSLEQQIKEVTDEILSMGFWDKGCKKTDCEYCSLRAFIDR